MSDFTKSKQQFDNTIGKNKKIPESLITVNGEIKRDIIIRNDKGEKIEEYYKWQFIYAIINSGLYTKDYIGTEIHFPKGNVKSSPIKIDACIFDDREWIEHYIKWRDIKNQDSLEFLRKHCIGIIEFKKENSKKIEKVFNSQIKAYMKEPDTNYVLGIYYDTERVYLFQRKNGKIIRYDGSLNQKGDESEVKDLSLHIPDPYHYIPSFDMLKNKVNKPMSINRSNRIINDLEIIISITSTQIRDVLSNILRTLDKVGLVNQKGYEILIQTLALKIFDEKRNEHNLNLKLQFYIEDKEKQYEKLSETNIKNFISRMKKIYENAETDYQILKECKIDWKNENHVKAIISIVENFQDYSFVRSARTDLYQLVFYNFANEFKKDEKAQFLTPLPLIDFLVRIVNPRNGETVFDPCCGIADFLSLSYINSDSKLNDKNIYGVDLDENMIMLATLNMLLNGDGNAKLRYKPDKGSITWKFAIGDKLVELDPKTHKNGNWDNWADTTKLMKFDVVLTNPPFGEDRSLIIKTPQDKEMIEMYELWNFIGLENKIDLGIVFLENAYRVLKENGRLGIVLSNSIASINDWKKAREWLINKMRIVAIFDLPPNVFAETGVNTTLIVAYKPSEDELRRLKEQNYKVFTREIQNVGYEKRTSKRNVVFNKLYKIDETTFDIAIDNEGNPILDEDFSKIIKDFKEWANTQEETLKKLFLEVK